MTPYVSFRIGSSAGCRYWTDDGSVFPLTYLGISRIGPGRYKATIATMSSKWSGLSFTRASRIADPSSWNTPVVSPRESISYVFASSIGMRSMSISIPRRLNRSIASPKIVRFRRPRKSILSSPSSATAFISYCVTVPPPSASFRHTGMTSVSGTSLITTPAACTPACRRRPSSPRATSITRFESSSVSYAERRSVAPA